MDSSITNQIDAAMEKGKRRLEVFLQNKGIKDAEFYYLLTKGTQQVTGLYLPGNELSPLSMRRMRDRKWDSLTDLYLAHNRVGYRGCKYLSMVRIPEIEQIDLSGNEISSLGVSYLSKGQWKPIFRIDLRENRIGVCGVKELSKVKWLRSIEQISSEKNQLSVGQVHKLILCDMPNVEYVSVAHNKVEEWSKDSVRSSVQVKFVSAHYNIQG